MGTQEATAELVDVLERCAELLDDYSDVNDGDDGQPRPNRAMSLLQDVEAVLAALQSASSAPENHHDALVSVCRDLLAWDGAVGSPVKPLPAILATMRSLLQSATGEDAR